MLIDASQCAFPPNKSYSKHPRNLIVSASFADAENKDLPSYLDEDTGDSPLRDDKAVARQGAGGAFGSFASSWFGGVLNAVNKNLYW